MPHPPVRIACFGDSLTEGYGLAPDEALPVILEEMLRNEGIEADCLNFGVSGDTAGDGLRRIEAALTASPDAVIVEFGANDCFVGDPVDAIRATFKAILDTFQENDLPVLLVGITALLPEFGEDYKAEFDHVFANLADEYDLPLFPDILSCYFGDSSLTLMDGMHPNAQGVRAIAKGILPHVVGLARQA